MHLDISLAIAGLLVGFLVGLTGMGGGALLTPILVLLFRVAPLAAISSDLLASLVMKPVGGAVHLRHRSVNWPLVGWLTVGSVPAAFGGALLIGTIGHHAGVQGDLKVIIGIALCASVVMTAIRQLLDRRATRRSLANGDTPDDTEQPVHVQPVRTVLIGAIGGLAVGTTSVGAGSVIIAMLLLAYPTLHPGKLVGTDIVQAIPLVASATLGHLLFGDVQLAITTSLLVGALPGVYLGARLSAQGPTAVIRPVITGVLLASALALLKVSTPIILVAALAGVTAIVLLRRPVTVSPNPAPDPVH